MTEIPSSIARPRPFADFPGLARPIWKALKLRPREASVEVRGFNPADPANCAHLEMIGLTFISGYNAALDARDANDIRIFVDTVECEFRGFAAEGAGMGAAIRSSISLSTMFLQGVVQALKPDFDYLTHVGIGWATARIAWRARKHRLLLDPVHHWLADDGLGFHDAYFFHHQVRAGWRRYLTGYAARAYDQGVGRALWFVAGGNVAAAVALIKSLAPERQSDLWAGLGLATAYAGSGSSIRIAEALEAAGSSTRDFAQGVAFACAARAAAGHVPVHTEAAVRAVWGIGAPALCSLVRDARTALPAIETAIPRYETWRRSIAASFSLITGGPS